MASNQQQQQSFWANQAAASGGFSSGGIDMRLLLEQAASGGSIPNNFVQQRQDSAQQQLNALRRLSMGSLGQTVSAPQLNVNTQLNVPNDTAAPAYLQQFYQQAANMNNMNVNTPNNVDFTRPINNVNVGVGVGNNKPPTSMAGGPDNKELLEDLYKYLNGTSERPMPNDFDAHANANAMMENSLNKLTTQLATPNFVGDGQLDAVLAVAQQSQNLQQNLALIDLNQQLLANQQHLTDAWAATLPQNSMLTENAIHNSMNGSNTNAMLLMGNKNNEAKAAAISPVSKKSKAAQRAKNAATSNLPLRSLSAYNYFFRDERERLINGGDADYTANKRQALLAGHWFKDRTKKRRHRKTHGKIAFTELSKVISQRWKELHEDQKLFYREVAAEDMQRYQRELDQHKIMESQSGVSKSGGLVGGTKIDPNSSGAVAA